MRFKHPLHLVATIATCASAFSVIPSTTTTRIISNISSSSSNTIANRGIATSPYHHRGPLPSITVTATATIATRLYGSNSNSNNNSDKESILEKAANKIKSILPFGSKSSKNSKSQITTAKQKAKNSVSTSIETALKDAPLGIKLMGKLIAPILSNLVGSLAQSMEESQAQFDNVMKDVVYYLQINPKAQYLSSILAHSVLHGQRNGNLTPMNPPVQERIVYTQDVPTNTPANDLGNIQVYETNSVPHQRQQQNFPSNFIQSLPSSLQPSKSSPSYGQLVSISEENAQSPGRPVCRFDDGSVLSYRGIYERPRRPGEENYNNMVEIVDERCLRDSDIKREDIYERPRRPRDENYDNMVNTVDERCLRDSGIKREDMASKDAVIVEVPPNNFPPLPVPSVAKAALIDLSKRIDGKSNPLFSLS